jgi:hypothetical protein
MLAGAFLEDILQMPFMAGTRHKMMQEGVKNMSRAQIDAITGGKYQNPGRIGLNEFSPAIEARLASGGRDKLFQAGIDQASAAIPGAMERVSAVAREQLAALNAMLAKNTGYNLMDDYRARVASIANPAQSIYSIGFRRQIGRDNTGPIFENQYQNVVGAPGKGKPGDVLGNRAVIIQVQKLDVHATDVRSLQNRLIEFAGRQFAPAGT